MTAADAIQRILLAAKDKDYFRRAGWGVLRQAWVRRHKGGVRVHAG